MKKVKIPPEVVEQISESLANGKSVEISVRHGHLIVWEMASKKKYDEVAVEE